MAARNPQEAPHLSPATWGRLIDSLDAATIFVVISSWLGDDARAEIPVEDIWQEALWMAWRDRHDHEWSNLTRYRAWLLGIARNRLHDLLRASSRQKRGGLGHTRRFSDIGSVDTVGGLLPPRSTTPSRIASHMERARTFERALATLDADLAELVRLRVFEELSTREAAERLGIPLSTAKHRLVRGMQAYQEALGRAFGDERVDGPQEP